MSAYVTASMPRLAVATSLESEIHDTRIQLRTAICFSKALLDDVGALASRVETKDEVLADLATKLTEIRELVAAGRTEDAKKSLADAITVATLESER